MNGRADNQQPDVIGEEPGQSVCYNRCVSLLLGGTETNSPLDCVCVCVVCVKICAGHILYLYS